MTNQHPEAEAIEKFNQTIRELQEYIESCEVIASDQEDVKIKSIWLNRSYNLTVAKQILENNFNPE